MSFFKAIVSGSAAQEVVEKRRGICRDCEFRKAGTDGLGFCGVCGCPITSKTLFESSSCPKGKW